MWRDDIRNRRTARLRDFDYSSPGIYFITFRIARRAPLLAEIDDGCVQLTIAGRTVARAWRAVLAQRPDVRMLAGVIMPDHVHVLLEIPPTDEPRKSICRVIGAVKTYSAARINRARKPPVGRIWQRSFYDRVIRTPFELEQCRAYIANNPQRWSATHHDASPRPGRLDSR